MSIRFKHDSCLVWHSLGLHSLPAFKILSVARPWEFLAVQSCIFKQLTESPNSGSIGASYTLDYSWHLHLDAEVRKCEDDTGDKDDIDAFSQSDAKTVATTSLHSEALGARIAP